MSELTAVDKPQEARLLRGAPVVKALVAEAHKQADAMAEAGFRPTLAIVRVGERPDDVSYERSALKRMAAAGIETKQYNLPAHCSNEELIATIERINNDAHVSGCLMFRPLPSHLDERAACEALSVSKDIDCATEYSLASVFMGRSQGFPPCTPQAVLEILDFYDIELDGANVAIVGRSLVVGRPLALMLQARNATVTLCHSHTKQLADICSRADILIAAAGSADMIDERFVKEGQVVIDVGINWDEKLGKLSGDVQAEAVLPKVAALTPVPGGVGPVTTAVLAKHVVEAARRQSCEFTKMAEAKREKIAQAKREKIAEAKRELREYYRAQRKALSVDERARMDADICSKLLQSPQYQKAEYILSYLSVAEEVDTRALIQQAWADGKHVAIPLARKENRSMCWYEITDFQDVNRNNFGIDEPIEDEKKRLDITTLAPDKVLAIVPGLCFDEAGYRLGYGGGYYDSFLSSFKGASLGLCRKKFLVKDLYACDAVGSFDCAVDELVLSEN